MGFDPISAAVGGGLEYASAALNQRYQQEMQHGAQDYASEMYAHRYQTQVADLKAAGLNPMLAYMQSPGSSPQISAGGGGKADFAGAVNTTRLASAQEAKTIQDTKVSAANEQNIIYDSANKALQPALTVMQTMSEEARKDYTNSLVTKVDYEIDNLREQRDQIISETQRNNADANLKQQQILVERKMLELNAMKTILTQAQAKNVQLENIIETPKARAATTATAQTAADAQNIKRIIETVTDPVGDMFRSFRPFSRQAAYPRKAGD